MNLVVRKLQQKYLQAIKRIDFRSCPEGAVFLNSFPKSGTHLLYQIFENLPNIKNYYTFIASMPSFPHVEVRKNKIVKKINNIVNCELVRAHLFFDNEFVKLLKEKNTVLFFIYRDPRDVVISEANYLYDMNKFHSLHKFYKNLHNIDDRIMFSIMGNQFINTKYHYYNIYDRFNKYKGWLNDKNVFSIKYEDLVGESSKEKVKQIISYYAKQINNQDIENLFSIAISSINPQKSHTFREGGTNKWKKYFNKEHKKVFKEIAGDLLIELGYEKNFDW